MISAMVAAWWSDATRTETGNWNRNRNRNDGRRKGCKTVCVAPAAPASRLGNAGDHVDKLAVVVIVAGFVVVWLDVR